jgi:hypothetical protein
MMPAQPASRATHAARPITALPLAALVLLAACGSDVLGPADLPARGAAVLDGFIQPGLTLVPDSGTATTRIAFGPPTEFDAGEFVLERDTALAASSRGAGDLLYVASLATGSVRRIQLPAASNPARARLLPGAGGAARIGVALRDSAAIAIVEVSPAGTTSVTRIANAGRCPTDFARRGTDTWIVDANANCAVNYAVEGPVRLIRVPDQGSARDTIVLTGLRGSAASIDVVGDIAWVSTGGEANFASFPFTLVAPGAVARVDLKNRRLLTQRAMPAGSYGGSLKRGRDGFLYVSLYEDLDNFRPRVLRLRADDLAFVANGAGASGAPWLDLRDARGDEVACSGAVADGLGRLHCIRNGTASATSLLVFNALGQLERTVAAGQGGVDLALR